jgi:hypothetical protein
MSLTATIGMRAAAAVAAADADDDDDEYDDEAEEEEEEEEEEDEDNAHLPPFSHENRYRTNVQGLTAVMVKVLVLVVLVVLVVAAGRYAAISGIQVHRNILLIEKTRLLQGHQVSDAASATTYPGWYPVNVCTWGLAAL